MKDAEITLIIACARTELTPENQISIKKSADGIQNWEKLIRLALYHRMAGPVYTNLKKTCPDDVPKEILSCLKHGFMDNAVRNLSLSIRLVQLLDLFSENNIPAISFKGPLIAEKAYKDLNLRSFSDLDILVKKKDVLTVQNLLIQNGYKPEIIFSPARTKKYLEYENSVSFYGKSNVSIDLHWELTGRYLLNHVFFENLEARLESMPFLGRDVLCIPDDIMLVYLSLHGTSHCWERFEWLFCFVELARRQEEKTILNALFSAREMGAERIFLLGLYLGQDFLNLPYPEQIKKRIDSDRNLVKCAKKIKTQMFEQNIHADGDAAWRFSSVHILIRDSWRDRFRYLVYLFTTPTVKEWTGYQVPLWLTPIYRIIRPMRLAWVLLNKKLKL